VRISKKSHSHLKIESGGKRFFYEKDSASSYGELMTRGVKEEVFEMRRYAYVAFEPKPPILPSEREETNNSRPFIFCRT
jgi:hypothetical protein